MSRITDTFQQQGIRYDRTKLYIGDYLEFGNPFLCIDRKKAIDELAGNLTVERERFKREIQRAKDTGTTLGILVEQNTYRDGDRRIQIGSIEDLMLCESRYSTVTGEKLYRILVSWCAKYPIRVEFCAKRDTGKRIIEILGGGND
jgi:hypothetical protein